MRATYWCSGCLLTLALGVTGCSQTASMSYASVRLPKADRREALDLAVTVVRARGYRIAEYDAEMFQAQTAPLESTMRGGSRRLSDAALKLPTRVRRIVRLYVRKTDTGATVMCNVQLQRADTARRAAFDQQGQYSDVPRDTPIDRGEGLTRSQLTHWTDIGRDRDVERQIRQEVRQRFVERESAPPPAQ